MNANEYEVLLNDDRYEALIAEIIQRLTPSRDAVVEALAEFGVIPERVNAREMVKHTMLPECLTRLVLKQI